MFGDTVNTTARHESTGLPGKIHCSSTTRAELIKNGATSTFAVEERGAVTMKGKGSLMTYWLDADESNSLVNRAALSKIDEEVKDLLTKPHFQMSSTMQKDEEALSNTDLATLGDPK